MASRANTEDERFVRRVYRLRVLGLGAGACAVAATFAAVQAPPLAWFGMLLHALVWPHVALRWSLHDGRPQAAEMRNLLIDSALGGIWIALMHFMLLPSVLLATMLSMDKLAAGGWRLLARTATAQLSCAALGGLVTGFVVEWPTPTPVIVACLPLLIAYPLAVSTATYALVRKVRRQNRQLAELSSVDALTGLASRGHWEEAALGMLESFRRGGPAATMLLIDIDLFKSINDRYGHPVGDSVIRGIAAIIRRELRSTDIAGRYGGDEFAIVLPATRRDAAHRIAERIRERIIETSFDAQLRGSCTVSIGVAELSSTMHDVRAWLMQTDAALYRAKTRGRNCAVDAAA
ncbi:diguanylate cyclase [Solimonas soli]|uniref:diguanylate cyclase n=1 Tax=Solimonas soli TaxID=413479 RepID=UPI0004820575|nr:diguanylate cyclase [Solimonas soli]